jgi:uncharacterized protein
VLQRAPLPQDFTDEDIDALEDLLAGFDTDIEWTVGFLAAVVSGPELISPSVWLPVVIGKEGFADLADAQAGLALLMRFYNYVADTLRSDAGSLCPEPEDTGDVARFCSGYVAGSRRHPAWRDEMRDEMEALMPVLVFRVLAGEVEVSEDDLVARDGEEKPDPEAWKRRGRAELGERVAELYAFWERRRAPAQAAAVRGSKVGRNEPCPCGSGKKHKRCCLQ